MSQSCWDVFLGLTSTTGKHRIKSLAKAPDSGHDSSGFEPDGKIGVRRDGKKRKSSINMVSHDAPTVSARFIYGSTMTHDSSPTIHYGVVTNAHDAPTI